MITQISYFRGMIVSLTIVRYRKVFIPFAFVAMAIHHLPMLFQKHCSFYKLLGTGGNGAISIKPVLQQWAILACWDNREDFELFYAHSFISKWWAFFKVEKWTMLCTPLQSHGKWDGKEPFADEPIKDYNGPIVILTRAKIRFSRMKTFWKSVKAVAASLEIAPGRIFDIAIGETYQLAATFSVWDNVSNMKAYAYAPGKHADVIKRARDEDWLAEELFARFKPIAAMGTLNNADPLKGLIKFDEL